MCELQTISLIYVNRNLNQTPNMCFRKQKMMQHLYYWFWKFLAAMPSEKKGPKNIRDRKVAPGSTGIQAKKAIAEANIRQKTAFKAAKVLFPQKS